ncbi:MAG: hypothetical protein P1P77_11070 [Spirochaetaceae bacterium]|nr:hypothetical protein [Spirochaetaceae bacterium]
MKLGTISTDQLILSADQEANPVTMALNSIMELRYVVSRLNLDDAHDLLDKLENLVLKDPQRPL